MIAIRPGHERGHFNHGWLDTYHTFSFADYHDPAHMGFRALRVINEDRVAPGQGFGMHPHRDMEIITYILEGELEHADSMGHGSVIRAGEFQRMSAGSGVLHSEANPSATAPVHLYQIWIKPDVKGIKPEYEQRDFGNVGQGLRLVASPDGQDGSMRIHQDARLYLGRLDAARPLTHELAQGRQAWVQVSRGEVTLNSRRLCAGDGAAVSSETSLTLRAASPAEVLLFDLP